MNTKVQLVTPLFEQGSVYYVRDGFGRTWHTVASSHQVAKSNIKRGEDTLTFKLYTTSKMCESLPEYDFKDMILDMLEKMGLQDTYEYETVIGWDDYAVFSFMKRSSMHPCDLLIEINKFCEVKESHVVSYK
jgi:hypothetical protein